MFTTGRECGPKQLESIMIELTVTGMTCGGCAKAVEKAVHRQDASAGVAVDRGSGKVQISSDKPKDGFIEAIEAAGYEVERAA